MTVDILLPELREGNIDMIICASGHVVPSSEIVIEPLGMMKLSILARSGHPLAGKAKATMADIAAFPLAIVSARLPPSFPAGGGVSCENSQILREIVLASDALWFSCPQIVTSDLTMRRLTEIEVVDLPFRQVEVGVIRLAGRERSPAASTITSCVRSLLLDARADIASDLKR